MHCKRTSQSITPAESDGPGGVDTHPPTSLCVFIFVQEGEGVVAEMEWKGVVALTCHLTTQARSGCLGVCFEKIHMHHVQACMHA